ncbi:MAG: tripartite tricarboxylate transporter substrate binding protein [Planctomycetaceae bacterium]|nr:tripartite tricarboxylate transporter substrate binding protein [Planctomycetaceae bacterium]
MNVARKFLSLLLLLAGVVCPGCGSEDDSGSAYPRRPIKVVVPFSAGGGSDTFARIVQRAIDEQQLLDEPLVIVNVPGAGGTIGSRRVKDARPDGYTLLLLHDGILTAKYSGQAAYGPEAFEPVAGTGDVGLVIAVADDSPFQSLDDLIDAALAKPDEVLFSANLGAPVHFTGLMLEEAAEPRGEVRFRYVQHGGGAKRYGALIGGHAEVSAFSVAEYQQFREGGLRAIAYCGKESHPAVDAPTAISQDYDIVSRNMQFWWAPKGTSADRINFVVDVLKRAMQSESVRAQLAELQIDPVFLAGEELQAEIESRSERIASVSQRPTVDLPNLPLMTLMVVCGLGLIVAGQSWMQQPNTVPEATEAPPPHSLRSTLLTALLTILYVGLLQTGRFDFRIVTFLFVLFAAAVISPTPKRHLWTFLVTALVMSVGLHAVFTRIFVIDLP